MAQSEETWKKIGTLIAQGTDQESAAQEAAGLVDGALRADRTSMSGIKSRFSAWKTAAGTPENWTSFASALAQTVNHPNALHFLGQQFEAVGSPQEAIGLYDAAAILGAPQQQVDQLVIAAAMKAGLADIAISRLEDGLERTPQDINILHNLAHLLLSDGRPAQALKRLHQLEVKTEPTAQVSFNIGLAHEMLAQLPDAIARFEQADQLGLGTPDALYRAAQASFAARDLDNALTYVKKCIDDWPDHRSAWLSYADWLERANRLDEAEETVALALARFENDLQFRALEIQINRRRQGASADLADRIAGLTQSPAFLAAPVFFQSNTWFLRAEILDRLKDHRAAFEAFARANELARDTAHALAIDEADYIREIEARTSWAASKPDFPQLSPPEPLPGGIKLVFFVGFPRSGTTLMEQMLDSHPDIQTLDEKPLVARLIGELSVDAAYPELLESLTAEARDKARARYLELLGAQANASVLIDKLPLNLVNLELVVSLFPEAKIIFALRDPRDSCLSNYCQNFVLNRAMKNFTTLETTVATYDAVMTYGQTLFETLDPDRITYRYEDLVAAPEETLRKIIAFLDLEWTDQLLEHQVAAGAKFISTPSYEKVLQPVNASAVARWKSYWPDISDAFAPLDKWVKEFGYSEA